MQKFYLSNTHFIIAADHVASRNYHSSYDREISNYAAPIIFFTPDGSLKPQMINKPIQQIDIYPSVIDYLGINDTIIAFGKSVFDTLQLKNKFIVACRQGLYQIITDSLVLEYDSEKDEVIGLYNYRTDIHFEHNLNESKKFDCDKLLATLRAYVQQYTYRIRKNKLLPGK